MKRINMIAKRKGNCVRCYKEIKVGEWIVWFPETRRAKHFRKCKKGTRTRTIVYGRMTS